jgi:hypothetical protein
MVANTPGILPKTALVGSRVIYYPFTIPQKLNDSATLTGAALNGMVNGVTASVGKAYMDLKPRGPAKWLLPLFQKTIDATVKSDQIAQRNKTVFWDPFSQGVESVGRAFASPGAYWYLKKAGVEQPTQDMIKGVLNMPLFSFPVPSAGASEGPPPDNAAAAAAAAEAAAQQGAAQAAEGAGQAGPPAEQAPAA